MSHSFKPIVLGMVFLFVFLCFLSFWVMLHSYRILVPWPEIEPRPWQWKRWVLTTETPENSHNYSLYPDPPDPNNLTPVASLNKRRRHHLQLGEQTWGFGSQSILGHHLPSLSVQKPSSGNTTLSSFQGEIHSGRFWGADPAPLSPQFPKEDAYSFRIPIPTCITDAVESGLWSGRTNQRPSLEFCAESAGEGGLPQRGSKCIGNRSEAAMGHLSWDYVNWGLKGGSR